MTMHMLDDRQRQLLIQALINQPCAVDQSIARPLPDEDATLVALMSGVDTRIWVEKP